MLSPEARLTVNKICDTSANCQAEFQNDTELCLLVLANRTRGFFSPLAVPRLCVTIGRYVYLFQAFVGTLSWSILPIRTHSDIYFWQSCSKVELISRNYQARLEARHRHDTMKSQGEIVSGPFQRSLSDFHDEGTIDMWHHLDRWSRHQPFQNFIRLGTR